MKYRKKPVVIEAEQYNGQHIEGLQFEIEHPEEQHRADVQPYIQTLEGRMNVSFGDWIITGVKGERYPCKPDIFEATYETVVDNEVTEGNAQGSLQGQYNVDSEWSKHSRQESYVRLLMDASDKGFEVGHNEILNEIKLLKPIS